MEKSEQNDVQERNPRELESRETNEREKPWTPPNLLPDPKPEAGYVFRWIRTASAGQSDNMNVSTKFREGWTPCKAQDHPELQMVRDTNSQFKDGIEVGGLLLCKAPEEEIKKRSKYYTDMADQQMSALDANYMRDENPAMPMFKERKSQVTFGKGGK
tara:strand:+ start:377 stop:850 length:474 start_codon:yes stop_codon:yes gene_type:complete